MVESKVSPPSGNHEAGHLTESVLAAYLDHDLSPEERRRVEQHLDECVECRTELVASFRINESLTQHRTVKQHARRWWIAAALAAGVTAIVVIPRIWLSPPAPAVTMRTPPADGEGEPRITVIAPAENAVVTPRRVVFTWHAVAADLYRISLLTDDGRPLWTVETPDTTVAPPDSLALEGSHWYFWRVEAIGAGIAATTGVHRLQIAP